jgi:uncharacterized LabA/DUF88 family protein
LQDARVKVFMDYWNFVLDMRDWNHGFIVDYEKLARVLVREAGVLLGCECSFEGVRVYASFDPNTEHGRKDKQFFEDELDGLAGYVVEIVERAPRHGFKCSACHRTIMECPKCGGKLEGTVEKGVDTGLVTEIMQGAWDDTYDAAVLLTSDRDFLPAVDYLQGRGIKFIHAGFGQSGFHLPRRCWAHIALQAFADEFKA